MPKEITESYLKDKIHSWFLEEGNKHAITTFMKSLILQKINEEDMQSNLCLMKKVCDNIDVSVSLLVSDFFLQNYFHYTLSVFSSEVFSTSLRDYVSDYFNKISYGWDPRKLPTLDYNTVYKILLSLNINPKGSLGSDIINRYFLQSEGSLLKIIISTLKRMEKVQQYDEIISPDNKNLQTHKYYKSIHLRKIKEYLNKKKGDLYREILFEQRQFNLYRKKLSSCHKSLKLRLTDMQDILKQLSNEKKDYSCWIELGREQRELITEINEKLSILSAQLINTEVPNEPCQDSSSNLLENQNVIVNYASCQTEIVSKSIFCQTATSVCDKCIGTDDLQHVKRDIDTQTDPLVEMKVLEKFEDEKRELINFIELQQGRINTLTEKTIQLNQIISHAQSRCYDNVEVQTTQQLLDISEGNKFNFQDKRKQLKCCTKFDNLEKIVECHLYYIDCIKNRLNLIKENSKDTEKKFNDFIEKTS